MNKIDEPLNATERYLYGINVRLDALIHMLSEITQVYANQNGIAVTKNVVEEEIVQRKSRKK